MKTHMTLERGILFFEDGTEVSNVSVEMIKALPDLLEALKGLCHQLHNGRRYNAKKDFSLLVADAAARRAIDKAQPVST